MADFEKLAPTGQLILEVLGARYRLGEPFWPIDDRNRRMLDRLECDGLITHEADVTPGNRRARLTAAGRDLVLDPAYRPRGGDRG